jgi:hypothetical protein
MNACVLTSNDTHFRLQPLSQQTPQRKVFLHKLIANQIVKQRRAFSYPKFRYRFHENPAQVDCILS